MFFPLFSPFFASWFSFFVSLPRTGRCPGALRRAGFARMHALHGASKQVHARVHACVCVCVCVCAQGLRASTPTETHRHTEEQNRDIDTETHSHTGKQAERLADTLAYRYTDTCLYLPTHANALGHVRTNVCTCTRAHAHTHALRLARD